ncbi:hypothetical protein OIU76_027834 [Salix suchowensis]|nr:hypothetical protein OIU76_027834 [Salix suchowensis]
MALLPTPLQTQTQESQDSKHPGLKTSSQMVPNLVARTLMIRMKMHVSSGNTVSKEQINYCGRAHNKNTNYHHRIRISDMMYDEALLARFIHRAAL